MAKTKKWYPSVDLREQLREWPEGETSDYYNMNDRIGYRTMRVQEKLVAYGYVTKQPHPRFSHRSLYTRTALQPPEYKPRPELQGKQRNLVNRTPFPWRTAAEHWNAISGSPARVAANVAKQLGAAGVRTPNFLVEDNGWYTVKTTEARRVLRAMFEEPDFELYRYYYEVGGHRHSIPGRVSAQFADGRKIRLVLLEMLIEPEFDPFTDKFIRFRKLDGEKAKAEWERLIDYTPPDTGKISKMEEYRRFMRRGYGQTVAA